MEDKQEVVDREYFKELLATTPEGKEIYMVRKPNCSVRTIAFGTGGQLPACLTGGFSSVHIAKTAALAYVDALSKAKPKSKGRGSK